MTEAQAAWLRKLRGDGPQALPKSGTRACRICWLSGWSDWPTPDGRHVITPAGLAALAKHEGKGK